MQGMNVTCPSSNLLETLILEGKELERAVSELQASLRSPGVKTDTGRHGLVQLALLFDQVKTARRDLDSLGALIIDVCSAHHGRVETEVDDDTLGRCS